MTRLTGALAIAAVLAGAAPAAAQDRVHQQMMAEIRMLQEQQQQLQQLLGTLGETLRALNTKLDTQNDATRRAFADQKLVVDNMAEGIRILREKADDTSVRLSTLSQELEAMRQALASMPVYTPATPIDPNAPPGEPPPPQQGVHTPSPITGVSVQRQYDLSYGDFVIGQYDLAISGFEEFIKQFPDSALADDAQLNIGNSYLNSGRNKEAVAAFERVISAHPQSDSVPGAQFKLGMAYQALKQLDAARKAWEMVVQQHPNSNEAYLARQALERLNRK